MVIIDDKQIPDIAVNDPTVMVGLPASVTAATGMDALTHAIEAYVSAGHHTLTDPTALEAIRLIPNARERVLQWSYLPPCARLAMQRWRAPHSHLCTVWVNSRT